MNTSAKQDRQGARTVSDLERRYNFGKQFAEIMGVAQDARLAVDATASEIRAEVKQEVSSLTRTTDSITATVEKTEQDVEALQTSSAALQLTANKLLVSVDSVQADLADQTKEIGSLSKHFVFAENGLSILNNSTGMGILVSEEEVAFSGGHDPTTVITPNEMQTTNQRVLERLDLGNYAFIPRSNGNLSLRWTGGQHESE